MSRSSVPVTVILSKTIFRAFEAVGTGGHVAMLLNDFGAELFEAFDVEIDGAATDGRSRREVRHARARSARPAGRAQAWKTAWS